MTSQDDGPSLSAIAEHPCTVCSTPAGTCCTNCVGVYYCSEVCAQDDYNIHKLLCHHDLTSSPRPGATYRRGLLFPATEYYPKLVWVKVGTIVDTRGSFEFIAQNQPMCKLPERCKKLWYPDRLVRRNEMRARSLANALEFHYEALTGGTKNDAVVTATRGRVRFPFTSSVLVMKREGLNEEQTLYLDFTIADFRDASDYMTAWGASSDGDERAAKHFAYTPVKSGIMATLLLCEGSQRSKGCGPFVNIFVDKDDMVFSELVSPISKLVGMPIRARKYPFHVRDRPDFSLANQFGTYLFRDCNPMKDSFGWAPAEWQYGIGDVVIVRADGEDLDSKHIQALCHYAFNELDDPILSAFEVACEFGLTKDKEEVATKYFNAKAFTKFWGRHRAAMAFKDASWRTARAPKLLARSSQ